MGCGGSLHNMVVVLVTALLIASGSFIELLAQKEVVSISRIRSGEGDIAKISSSDGSCHNESCDRNFTTYLVEERVCENDTTLQRSE